MILDSAWWFGHACLRYIWTRIEMRLKLALIVMVGLPVVSAAQPAPVTSRVAPLPPIGLPLPPIGFPLPHIGLPLPANELPPATVSERGGAVSHPVRRQHRSAIYFLPVYSWPYLYHEPMPNVSPASPDRSPTPAKRQRTGRLRLDIEPHGEQQLYVDGYFVGTSRDFDAEIDLEAGPHTIEIQSPGYETLHVDVNIAPGRSITYRETMKARDAKAAPEAAVATSPSVAPSTPMTLYTIPGCYIGNVIPQDGELPAGCDLSRLITIKP